MSDYETDYKIINLAFSVYHNPGVYALLIGSGVSKAAGIKTGWEITLDLISKVACLSEEKPEPDTEAWYLSKYGEEPDYSNILEKLAKTSSERMNLLKSYFEPSGEDIDKKIKIPTKAHYYIAELVKLGCVKMILTTNFDRLIEKALEETGITPYVIKTESDFEGALPYIHSNFTLIKLHGDYKDTRIKNTEKELSEYSEIINRFLEEIFDRFGLIVCGWSGKYDSALADALLRSPNRRFPFSKGKLEDEAKHIIKQRNAEVVDIESADQIFTDLGEKVKSLGEYNRKSPISIEAEVAMVKRYIVDSKDRIKLHDFIRKRTEETYKDLISDRFDLNMPVDETSFQNRMKKYETVIEPLIKILIPVAYYDKGENSSLLTSAINRIATLERQSSVFAWSQLQKYPSLLFLYSLGISSLLSNNFFNLAAILRDTKLRDREGKINLVDEINPVKIFYGGLAKLIERPNQNEYTPANNYLFDIIRPIIKDYTPDEQEYEEIFDRFEYLFALNYIDLKHSDLAKLDFWAPIGRFLWKHGFEWRISRTDSLLFKYVDYIKNSGSDFDLFKAGFFNGSVERFIIIEDAFRKGFLKKTER